MLAAATDGLAIDQVRKLERQRIAATRSNDVPALASLLDDGLIYVNSVGKICDKAGYLRDIETHCLTYGNDFEVVEQEFRVFDGLVILAGIMLGHSRLDGEQQVFRFRSLGVWRLDQGNWRMVAWQSSSSSLAL